MLTPVVAHEGAVVRCQIIHRDVSSGNILICLVLFLNKDNRLEVKRAGMLADWEVAKSIEARGGQRARQPERTVRVETLYWLNTGD